VETTILHGSNLVEHAHFHALPYCHLHLDTSVESDCDHTARTYGSIWSIKSALWQLQSTYKQRIATA